MSGRVPGARRLGRPRFATTVFDADASKCRGGRGAAPLAAEIASRVRESPGLGAGHRARQRTAQRQMPAAAQVQLWLELQQFAVAKLQEALQTAQTCPGAPHAETLVPF